MKLCRRHPAEDPGYRHIKDASVGPAKAEEEALRSRWEKLAEKVLTPA